MVHKVILGSSSMMMIFGLSIFQKKATSDQFGTSIEQVSLASSIKTFGVSVYLVIGTLLSGIIISLSFGGFLAFIMKKPMIWFSKEEFRRYNGQ
jgi:hypothetical protein